MIIQSIKSPRIFQDGNTTQKTPYSTNFPGFFFGYCSLFLAAKASEEQSLIHGRISSMTAAIFSVGLCLKLEPIGLYGIFLLALFRLDR
jgi:hypothetical protein